ncbi:MAG: type 4a pilus biogenesis protein PilO [Candidatus Omnitrophota bacterium]|jgi:Tfp pilus assembly protein PilO
MIPVIFSKREKYIFIITVVFIASAFLYNFIFEPSVKKWLALDSEIEAKKAEIENNAGLITRKDSIRREYDRYAGPDKNISAVLSDMESSAHSFGIKTSNIKPGKEAENGLYKEYGIELQIEGEMPDIIKFLSEVVKLPTLAALKRFDFKLISQNPPIFKGTVILSKIITTP